MDVKNHSEGCTNQPSMYIATIYGGPSIFLRVTATRGGSTSASCCRSKRDGVNYASPMQCPFWRMFYEVNWRHFWPYVCVFQQGGHPTNGLPMFMVQRVFGRSPVSLFYYTPILAVSSTV